MSAIKFELEAEVRTDLGKGASRRLRRTNKVPAVVYGAGEEVALLTLDHNKVVTALSHEATYSHILTLKVNSKSEKVILKAIQRDPANPRIQHIDFLRVRMDQKLHMHVPLHFVGDDEAEGVKQGGVIYHAMSDVEVSCLPGALPEFIEVNTSAMKMDETLHLSDIKLPEGVELVAFAHGVEDHDLPVVSIHIPRVAEEDLETDETAEAGDDAATDGAEANSDSKE
jgi:large subunit ribosomal protein L25